MVTDTPAWDDRTWLGLAAIHGDRSADACVIGLGGSGLAAITELLGHGQRVVGLDAREVGGGAAGRNGGFLLAGGAPFHHDAVRDWGVDAALAVHHGTLEELDRMAGEAPHLVRRTGSLRIAVDPTEREDCDCQEAVMREHRLAVERYHGEEGEGLLFPTDAAFQPLEHCRLRARAVQAEGAMLFEQSTVQRVESGAVVTGIGTVYAPLIIVAVDGALGELIPSLRDRVRPVRLQMLATAPTDEIRIARPVYSNYGYDYWQQLPDGRLVVGGGRDRVMSEEETSDEDTTQAVQSYLDHLLRAVIGARNAVVTHRWAGVVGYTADERPIVTSIAPGVWAVGGYSGTGNLVGRRVARGVVQQALTGHTDLLRGFIA